MDGAHVSATLWKAPASSPSGRLETPDGVKGFEDDEDDEVAEPLVSEAAYKNFMKEIE